MHNFYCVLPAWIAIYYFCSIIFPSYELIIYLLNINKMSKPIKNMKYVGEIKSSIRKKILSHKSMPYCYVKTIYSCHDKESNQYLLLFAFCMNLHFLFVICMDTFYFNSWSFRSLMHSLFESWQSVEKFRR